MDGGITPERIAELDPNQNLNEVLGDWPNENDFEGATLFIGTKGKVSCGWGGNNPRLFPQSLQQAAKEIPEKYPRIFGGMDGHWWQWIDASIAGYGKMEVDSPFEGYAGPLTETVLLGNLLLRSFNDHKGRYIALKWEGEKMQVTNYAPANQYIKREYRKGWDELKF